MIGQTLLGQDQPFINPFLQGNTDNPDPGITMPEYGAMGPAAPQTGPGAASPAAPQGNHPWKNYVQGWKNLIGNFKTDPNMRVAMFQTLLSMTQPDSTPAAAIGRGLNAGVGTPLSFTASFSGDTSTTGAISFDFVEVDAVPEPTHYALGLFGVAFVGTTAARGLRRFKAKA